MRTDMNRRDFVAGSSGAAATLMSLRAFGSAVADPGPAARPPVLFIGHDNTFTRSLRELGQRTERPRAVLVVSAHWLTPGRTAVSTHPKPPTIHDFGGFPDELYRVTYPAPGQPELARAAAAQVKSLRVHEDHEMGLDHGAWSILHHLWPKADLPVFQLSIDYARPPAFHYDLGRELRGLRDRGVLVIGSGNLVHNLRRLDGDEGAAPYEWAQAFDAWARERLAQRDDAALVAYDRQPSARLAVPTNDHYLPMLYVLGLLEEREPIRFTHESFQHGSISMRCFATGAA